MKLSRIFRVQTEGEKIILFLLNISYIFTGKLEVYCVPNLSTFFNGGFLKKNRNKVSLLMVFFIGWGYRKDFRKVLDIKTARFRSSGNG